MSLFILKLIALLTMTVDHVGRFFFPTEIEWLLIGRLAFPIFAWGIANGYRHTSNVKHYMLRLGVFALISQIPFTLVFVTLGYNPRVLNIFFTLLLGLVAMVVYDRLRAKELGGVGVLAVLGIALLATVIPTDYGAYGVLLTFVFYLTYGKPLHMLAAQAGLWFGLFFLTQLLVVTPIGTSGAIQYIASTIIIQIVALLSVGIISLYNGVQGPRFKWLFYWYYPLHLTVLLLIAILI